MGTREADRHCTGSRPDAPWAPGAEGLPCPLRRDRRAGLLTNASAERRDKHQRSLIAPQVRPRFLSYCYFGRLAPDRGGTQHVAPPASPARRRPIESPKADGWLPRTKRRAFRGQRYRRGLTQPASSSTFRGKRSGLISRQKRGSPVPHRRPNSAPRQCHGLHIASEVGVVSTPPAVLPGPTTLLLGVQRRPRTVAIPFGERHVQRSIMTVRLRRSRRCLQ